MIMFLGLFVLEVLIAIFCHDRWIRPYGGDFLVVMLLYCFVRAFLPLAVLPAALGVWLFSFLVEFLQSVHLVDRLGLGHNRLARIILGTSFEWGDLVAYTLGIAVILLLEREAFPGRSGRKQKTG